jgi:hypothetical protein
VVEGGGRYNSDLSDAEVPGMVGTDPAGVSARVTLVAEEDAVEAPGMFGPATKGAAEGCVSETVERDEDLSTCCADGSCEVEDGTLCIAAGGEYAYCTYEFGDIHRGGTGRAKYSDCWLGL